MKHAILGFLLLAIISSGHSEEPSFLTKSNAISDKNIEFKNGTLIIKNVNINVSNINKAVIKIKESNDVKSIVLRNVRIKSHNARITNYNDISAILAIETNKRTRLKMNNVSIDSRNAKIFSKTRNSIGGCASNSCIRTKGKVAGKPVKNVARGSHDFTAIAK